MSEEATIPESVSVPEPEPVPQASIDDEIDDDFLDDEDEPEFNPETDLIFYNTTLQVLVCSEHESMIEESLQSHLEHSHPELSDQQREVIRQKFEASTLVRVDDLDLPRSLRHRVRGLQDPTTAYQCIHDCCGFIHPHVVGISNHAMADHQWKPSPHTSAPWKRVYVQALLEYPSGYFYVVMEHWGPWRRPSQINSRGRHPPKETDYDDLDFSADQCRRVRKSFTGAIQHIQILESIMGDEITEMEKEVQARRREMEDLQHQREELEQLLRDDLYKLRRKQRLTNAKRRRWKANKCKAVRMKLG